MLLFEPTQPPCFAAPELYPRMAQARNKIFVFFPRAIHSFEQDLGKDFAETSLGHRPNANEGSSSLFGVFRQSCNLGSGWLGAPANYKLVMMSARLLARTTTVRTAARTISTQHNLFYVPSLSPTMSKLGSIDWSKDIGSPVAKGGERLLRIEGRTAFNMRAVATSVLHVIISSYMACVLFSSLHDYAEHFATLKTSKPVAVGNESKGKVREIKLSAEKSGFLAAVGMSGGKLRSAIVDSQEEVAKWSTKTPSKKRSQVKW